jgi:signal transduction histidine kinase
MKWSIRKKVFLLFTAFAALMVLLGILSNALLLERYSIARNRVILRVASNRIERLVLAGKSDWEEQLLELDRNYGIGIRISDSDYNVVYSSSAVAKGTDAKKISKEIREFLSSQKWLLRRDHSDVTVNDYGNENLIYARKLDNGNFLILSKSIKGIQESVTISNRFYLIVGIGLTLIGGAATLIVSRVITKPVIEMSRVAANIAELDFSERIDVATNDELGRLGTSINEISEKLSRSIGRMQQDIVRRKRLVRDLSHELKTPIGVIKGYAEGLQFGVADDPDKTARYCGVIAAECDRMDGMIRQLLELSRLENAETQLNSSVFPVERLLGALDTRFERDVEQKAIRLRMTARPGTQLKGDFELLDRALSNLLTNAIRYTPEQGEILLSVEMEEQNAVLRVFNSGAHIPAEELDRIWDVFYTMDRARGRGSDGHGVGLAIVQSILALHGGSVSARNTEDGVEFCLQIPQ